ncbi:MAG: 2-hydroxyacyl-CoA dehydratase family protein [Proteobacteria bacterium]|nr:2-hydroxyacyl-CoA dehydratase family protein [Pseudomonadota bacterium]MBU1687436.1 2-hydroxyacyl-CoA dehydratase family protein [Pseudomonadota bacterium]
MENERFARMQKTTRLHLGMEATETLQRLTDFPDQPKAMDYFYDFFRRTFADGLTLPPRPAEQKVIGTMCLQVPDELIVAAGAKPLRLCSGAYAFDQVGAEMLPAKSCPLVRATTGMLHANHPDWGRELAAVVIPTTCDQKKKCGEMIATMPYPVYNLEMPSTKDSEASRLYWQESVKQFTLDLQGITGRKITARSLQAAITQGSAASALFRRLDDLRKSGGPVIFGKDIFLVTSGYFIDDPERWGNAVHHLITELEERKQAGLTVGNRAAPRLLLTGSPPIFPNLKVPILVEQSGGVIVADEVCSSNRLLSDGVAYDQVTLNDMVPAVADRALKPCTCPCLTPNHDRSRRLVELIRDRGIEGVVYQAFSGCLPYEMEQRQINTTLSGIGVPMLYLETDYSPEDQGQLATRIEAFIESIIARRRKK